ncbi:hypothetical protein [Ammoniphilus sp. 3BR4]|uniref:hypothetical protein n=1 Tax=Ammoniphilus sp. 3BR4 TaxID=3158265 RepID=UPI0034673DA7
MKKTLEFLFMICLILFLISGALLVIGQVVGVILQNGDIILLSEEILAKPSFILSAMAGVIAYILNNLKDKTQEDIKESNEINLTA